MDRLSLTAEPRVVLGKKVKNLRKDGFLPGHVYGKGIDGTLVTVKDKDFLKIFHLAGETGLVDLKLGQKVHPVLIREVQYDPISGAAIHIDFYQVNLSEKVTVPVPLVLVGEEPEAVHLGEAIVLQTLNELQVSALPTDLVEKIEVDQGTLAEINDAITVNDLNYDRGKLTILADPAEIVAKLAPAVSAETQELLEEQAAEQAEAAAEAVAEGVEAEGPEPVGPDQGAPGEAPAGEQPATEAASETPTEEQKSE